MKLQKRKKEKLLPLIYLILSIAVLGLGVASFIYLKDKSTGKEIESFEIIDDCSLILNNLIHEIGSEENCNLSCDAECSIREKQKVNSTFTKQESNCNSCFCVCK